MRKGMAWATALLALLTASLACLKMMRRGEQAQNVLTAVEKKTDELN